MDRQSRPLDSWDIFVLRHRKTPNLILHVISFLMFWLSLPLAVFFKQPLWGAGFLLSGLMGTAGHYFFTDGTVDKREATSSAQVVYYSSSMVLLFVTGLYGKHIRAAEARFGRYLSGEIESLVANDEIAQKLGRIEELA